jgi:D-arginine dehydrogenase
MGVDMSAWPMIVDVEETIYFKPDAGSLMLSPVDEEATEPHDAFADEVNVATAVHRFELLTSHTVQRVIAQWAGLRTMAPDRRPVIGYDATVEGLFWLAGQGGFGIQTALGAAALSRSLLISGTGDLPNGLASVAPLVSPARFGQLCV